jgi:hypothetical protein
MSLAQRLDDLLRERVFQRIADAVRDRSGETCFVLAAQAALAILATTSIWSAARFSVDGFSAGMLFVCFCGLVCGISYYPLAVAADRAFAARHALPSPAPLFFRLFFLPFSLADLLDALANGWLWRADAVGDLAHLLVDLAFLSYFQFMACRPKPPRRQEARVPAHAAMAGASP